MRINPKITDAATITPTTTLGRPDFELVLAVRLASALPVFTDWVEVLVMVEVDSVNGDGLVTTEAEVVVEVEVGVVEVDVLDGVDVGDRELVVEV